MRYDTFTYLFPPRPDNAIIPNHLAFYERQGWVGQYKKNGTCSIIAISPNRDVIAMNRHSEAHRQWKITGHIKNELLRLFPESGWFYLIGEVLHAKTKTIKDTLYLFDCVVWNGEYLVGSTFGDRCKLLDDRLVTNVQSYSHYICDSENKLWYAKRLTKDFLSVFEKITDPTIDEGLVLKDPTGKLSYCHRAESNAGWQVKCRHKHKNYSF